MNKPEVQIYDYFFSNLVDRNGNKGTILHGKCVNHPYILDHYLMRSSLIVNKTNTHVETLNTMYELLEERPN